jgi:aldehyde dehydrogenase (NAD(P)+)
VDEIHVTGSERTHLAIAEGPGAGKPLTSELGNVSPTIVIPGPWTARDRQFQCENIATQKAHNAGFNCIASQVLILPREWRHAEAIANGVSGVFDAMEQRPEYYPGAAERRSQLAGEQSPPRSVFHLDAKDPENPAFSSEAFCGVLACVQLDGDLKTYVRDAVDFANRRLRGTLGVNIIVHPQTAAENPALIEDAIASLRYGCVGVNAWTGVGYFITETPWGAYPGHSLYDPGSGLGVVHNSYLLSGTEKSVVRAPFSPFPRSLSSGEYTLLPKPPWFVTNRRQAQIGRALCDFEAAPSPVKAAAIASLAMRG